MTEKDDKVEDDIVEQTIKEVEKEMEDENPLLGINQETFTQIPFDKDDLQININKRKQEKEKCLNRTQRCLVISCMVIAPWLVFILNSLAVIFGLFFFQSYMNQQPIPWYEVFVIITMMFVSLLIINMPICIILIFCCKIFK